LAEIEKLTDENMKTYKKSVADYDDVQLMMQYSQKKGREKGREEGREEGITSSNLQIAKNLQQKGMSVTFISEATGLTPEQIQQIK
jgi:predicted transposase/invertase (TIGR01784 family)